MQQYGSLGETGFFTESTPLNPHRSYSACKASADFLVKAYFDTLKRTINITRCSNIYGPFQFPEKLIPLIINNALKGKELPIYGDGKNVRDWLFVEDHCKAIDFVISNGRIGEVYLLSYYLRHKINSRGFFSHKFKSLYSVYLCFCFAIDNYFNEIYKKWIPIEKNKRHFLSKYDIIRQMVIQKYIFYDFIIKKRN